MPRQPQSEVIIIFILLLYLLFAFFSRIFIVNIYPSTDEGIGNLVSESGVRHSKENLILY